MRAQFAVPLFVPLKSFVISITYRSTLRFVSANQLLRPQPVGVYAN